MHRLWKSCRGECTESEKEVRASDHQGSGDARPIGAGTPAKVGNEVPSVMSFVAHSFSKQFQNMCSGVGGQASTWEPRSRHSAIAPPGDGPRPPSCRGARITERGSWSLSAAGGPPPGTAAAARDGIAIAAGDRLAGVLHDGGPGVLLQPGVGRHAVGSPKLMQMQTLLHHRKCWKGGGPRAARAIACP